MQLLFTDVFLCNTQRQITACTNDMIKIQEEQIFFSLTDADERYGTLELKRVRFASKGNGSTKYFGQHYRYLISAHKIKVTEMLKWLFTSITTINT